MAKAITSYVTKETKEQLFNILSGGTALYESGCHHHFIIDLEEVEYLASLEDNKDNCYAQVHEIILTDPMFMESEKDLDDVLFVGLEIQQ